MERIGEDTVTFVQIGKGAKSDRGIPQAVEESSTDVQWCSFQPLGVHYHVTDVSLPDATDRCLAPRCPRPSRARRETSSSSTVCHTWCWASATTGTRASSITSR